MSKLLPEFFLPIPVLVCLLIPSLPRPAHAGCEVDPTAGIAVHLVEPTNKSGKLQCNQTSWGGCGDPGSLVNHGNVGIEYSVYLVAIGLAPWERGGGGLAGISFGINYDGTTQKGVDIFGWNPCSDFSSGENDWPEPGSGIELRYNSCQANQPDTLDSNGFGITVLGYFSVGVYGPDVFSVTSMDYREHPVPRLTDCNGKETLVAPWRLGRAAFGSASDEWNPCPFIDSFYAPCCFQDSCVVFRPQACCLDAGGIPLVTSQECADCVTSVSPTTWGRIKEKYDE